MGSLCLFLLHLLPPQAPAPSPLLCLRPDGPPFWTVDPFSACCWLCRGGGGFLCCPLLPLFPISACPISSSTPPASTFPTPSFLDLLGLLWWCRGLITMLVAPPEMCLLSGPQWPRPALRASPSPLMGKVRPPPLPVQFLPSSCLRPPPPHFVLRWGGGFYPLPCLCLSPSPLPPLRPLLPRPLAPWIYWACCGGRYGVWPLCGPPPGGVLNIRATMTLTCSFGVPLPPNG